MALAQKKTATSSLLSNLMTTASKWLGKNRVRDEDKQVFIHELLSGDSMRDLQKQDSAQVEEIVHQLWDNFQTRRFEEIFIDIREDRFDQPGRVDIALILRQIPFITDSMLNLLHQFSLSIGVMLNASIKVRRDDDGNLLSIHAENETGPDLQEDKVLYLQCENRGAALNVETLRNSISDILRDVQATVNDWRPMQGQVAEAINELEFLMHDEQSEEANEAAQFLTFLMDGHFTFLGYREHTVRREKDMTYFDLMPEKSLGILRDEKFLLFDGLVDELIPMDVKKVLENPEPLLLVLNANRRAMVHRHVHMDVIVLKRYDRKKQVETLRLFAGLFTARCYAKPPEQIPYLKRKVNVVLTRSGHDVDTHGWRALKHVLDSYPRDELFQIDNDLLYDHAVGIGRLNNRPEVDFFVRKDILQRYFSVIVYLPKDLYDTPVRIGAQKILEEEMQGMVVAHYVTVDEKPLARLQFMVATRTPTLPDYDASQIRMRLTEMAMPWPERLKIAALHKYGKAKAEDLLQNLTAAFSIPYMAQVDVDYALEDLEPIQKLINKDGMVVTLRQHEFDPAGQYRIKIYKQGEEASLSELLPILDRMGFQCHYENAYLFKPQNGLPHVWLHELVGKIDQFDANRLQEIEPIFAESFPILWQGLADTDSFNALILSVGLNWREANFFRALARYLDLASYPLGKRYIGQVLQKYPAITAKLRDLFVLRHDPSASKEAKQAESMQAEIAALLDTVETLDEDRTLRSIQALIMNILRTNYFVQTQGDLPFNTLVLKMDAAQISDLPEPRPYREIFVYNERVEAVHMRFGPIARGGIRWSDRYEDFRTEILGLVKAQQVKNAVIVPVGAKGGFICKKQYQMKTPQERQQEGIACYQIMVRSLLSVTDNLVKGEVVPPRELVRQDSDDPYLVVAADKGTASFSDIANAISLEKNFWLGDAFASGGSKGYDHKAMGITARGAWECVKRHFRELGKDIQTELFTVAGVGDMSGDVFGNGMLLSEKIQLVAAFDHRHIFIDPTPDAATSFAERQRLFDKPASSWMDYDQKLLSKGGAIFSRQEKSLTLTPEIRALLEIEAETVTPMQLMQAILLIKVELMYFGGIGTYIKASTQTHEQVGDKGNDAMRIDARDLRCRVIGEGANLAMTQAARIEFAQHGGKLNTDFIDNSAGVDTSDHEVNIKILLQSLVQQNKLSVEDRDKLLVAMTKDVGQHVLKNNYDQSLGISLLEANSAADAGQHTDFIRQLGREGLLNRRLEGLPDEDTLQQRARNNLGLVRPELAILMAYGKMDLYNNILRSDLPDNKAVSYQLFEYFPDMLQEKLSADIPTHKLKREIIGTEIANVIVNRMGPMFPRIEAARHDVSMDVVAKAWLLARDVFGSRELWLNIDAMDNKLSAAQQHKLYMLVSETLAQATGWFIKHYGRNLDIDSLTAVYKGQLQKLQPSLVSMLPPSAKEMLAVQKKELETFAALSDSVRDQLLQLPVLLACCDVIYLQQSGKKDLQAVAGAYFTLAERLHLLRLSQQFDALPADNAWTQEARDSLKQDLQSLLAELSNSYLQRAQGNVSAADWLEKETGGLSVYDDMLNNDLPVNGVPDLALLTVIMQRLRRVVTPAIQPKGKAA